MAKDSNRRSGQEKDITARRESPEKEKKPLSPSSPTFVVKGQIRDSQGRPLSGLTVCAYDQDLRKFQKLGKDQTNPEGHYRITYSLHQFRRAEKESADLFVMVMDADDQKLDQSPVLFNAPPEVTIDRVIDQETPTDSEFERLVKAVRPLLVGQGINGEDLPIGQLTREDVAFIANDTGFPVESISYLIKSVIANANVESGTINSLHNEEGCADDFPVEVFYGWFRKRLPTDLSALWAQPQDVLVSTLKAAMDEWIIPKISKSHFTELTDAIADVSLAHVLRPAAKDQPGSLGDLFSTMPRRLSREKERLAATVLRDPTLMDDDIEHRLKKEDFSEEEIANLSITSKLGTLADNHTAMIRDLQAKRPRGRETSLRYLATLSPFDWMQLVDTHGAAPGATGDLEGYALELERRVEEEHPTAVFAARVQSGNLELKENSVRDAARFLHQHAALELKNGNVIAYLDKHADDVAEPEKAQLAKGLQQIQRIQKLTRDWRETGVVLNKGFDSSLAIVRYGEDGFVEAASMEIPRPRAAEIYSNAQITHDTTVATLVGTYVSLLPSTFSVFEVPRQPDQAAHLANYPNLRQLFGNLDMCECAHCQSVLSPAAYLVDLLEFLDPKGDVNNGAGAMPLRPSGLTTLLARRPDIADLELTCLNTKTEVPYIDLVLEILENAIGLPIDIPSPYGFDPSTDLDLGGKVVDPGVEKKLRLILERSAISVGQRITARKSDRQLLIGTHTDWVVTDGARHWVLRYCHESFTAWKNGAFPSQIDSDDYSGMVQQLNEGHLPDEEWVLPKNGSKREKYLPLKEPPTVAPGKDDNTWTVTYTRAIRVVLQKSAGGKNGRINIVTVQGGMLDSIAVGPSVLALVESRLRDGTIIEPLISFLPSGYQYAIVKIQDGEWEIFTKNEMKVVYVPSKLQLISLTYQSTDGRLDLLAAPENRNPEAYNKLAAAVYPWSLPFDLWLEEVRIFLERRGLTRRQLMDLSNPAVRLNESTIVREMLGLSLVEWNILISPSQEPWNYWGLRENGNHITDRNDGRSRAAGSWLDVLKTSVSFLLQQSGLSYRELRNVLQTQFVQKGTPTLTLVGDECNVSLMRLRGLSGVHLDRIHRIVRLWKKLGGSLFDVDLGIAAVTHGTMDLTEVTLRGLSHIKRLHELLGLSIGTISQWWASLTISYDDFTSEKGPVSKSAYERRCLNPLIVNPPDADFLLNEQKSELAYLNGGAAPVPLLTKAGRLGAFLGIKQSELTELVADLVAQQQLDDPATLDLANLASVFRHVGLAKSLGLSIQEYLIVKTLIGINPFESPEKAVEFVEDVAFIKGNGVSIEEIEYLLHHPLAEKSIGIFSSAQAAQILRNLQSTLQSVQKEVLVYSEPHDEHLRRMLSRIGWYEELIEEGISLFSFANQATMPAPVTIPIQLSNKAKYQQDSRILTVSLQLTQANWDELIADNAAEQSVVDAITLLNGKVNAFLAFLPFKLQRVQSFDLPTHQVPYTTHAKVKMPSNLTNRCFIDRTKKVIKCVGWLTDEQTEQLKKALPQGDSNIADQLKAQSDQYSEQEPLNRFIHDLSELKNLFGVDSTNEVRVQHVFQRILRKLYRNTVSEHLRLALDANDEVMRRLLIVHLRHAEVLDVLYDPALVESDSKVSILISSFPDQFAALCKVQKAALVARVLNIKASQLSWLPPPLGQRRSFSVLDLNALPVKKGDQPASFTEWKQLVRLFSLRDRSEMGQELISRVLTLANADDLTEQKNDENAQHLYIAEGLDTTREEVARAAGELNFQWPADYTNQARFKNLIEEVLRNDIARPFKVGVNDLRALTERLGLTWPTDHLDPNKLEWLTDLLAAVQRLGASATEVFTLVEDRLATNAKPGKPGKEEAFLARGLLRAKYDENAWPAQLRPITNVLRDKQRMALVAYLVVHPPEGATNGAAWTTPKDLYDHYLIDVEMSPCRVSTRILHAISAVQLFIQRCLMNLEAPQVLPSAIDAKRWEWMKNYRVWEANRKVFLYPENWIEPELRDDKSELFKELEGQLSQNELDNERAKEILKEYLKGLEDIARLNIVGMYVDKLIDAEGFASADTHVHIVGRTQNRPSHFFYRRWILSAHTNYWTAWEKLPLNGVRHDHILPFVLNGEVYIAWPEMIRLPSEADQEAEEGQGQADTPGPKWQLKMAWIRNGSRGWSDQYRSGQTIAHPWVYNRDEDQSFAFRVRVGMSDSMEIDCYGALRVGRLEYTVSDEDGPSWRSSSLVPNDSFPRITVEFHVRVQASYKNNTVAYPLQGARVRVSLDFEGIPDDVIEARKEFGHVRFWNDGDPGKKNEALFQQATQAVFANEAGACYIRMDLHYRPFYEEPYDRIRRTARFVVEVTPPSGAVKEPNAKTKRYAYLEAADNDHSTRYSQLAFSSNFVFEGQGGPPNQDSSLPLAMKHIATTIIWTSEDAETIFIEDGAPLPVPTGMISHASGYKAGKETSVSLFPVQPGAGSVSLRQNLTQKSSFLPVFPVDMPALELVVYKEKEGSYFIRKQKAPIDPQETLGKYQVLVDGHPRASSLRRHLLLQGLHAAFDLDTQQMWHTASRLNGLSPIDAVDIESSLPEAGIYFEPDCAHSPYARYNTEFFFHVPLLIANYLTRNQRYVEAQRWFHHIFDPTTDDPTPGNARYWRYLPFRIHSQTQPIDELLKLLSDPNVPNDLRRTNIQTQVRQWLDNPFRPHAVARLRPRAYEFTVVFKYLDNLLAWGDQLFRQYSTESINEATQLYILAAKLLGPRPQSVPRNKQPAPLTYRMASGKWDYFANTWAEVESNTQWNASARGYSGFAKSLTYESGATYTLSSIGMLYFCVPINEKMFEYWRTVEDRLFNIRNCRNIEGMEQQLALFQPPIDPALLVRATAAGLDINAVLSDAATPVLPHYRFGLMAQKASELCGEVKALGGALLAALEKKDAEELSLLRSTQEVEILDLIKTVKEQQIEEAKTNLVALQQSEKVAIEKFSQYQRSLGKTNIEIHDDTTDIEQSSCVKVARNANSGDLSGLGVTHAEQEQIVFSERALGHAIASSAQEVVAGILHGIPDLQVGTLIAQSSYGGSHLGNILGAGAAFSSMLERHAKEQSSRADTIGKHQRRQDEWVFQSRVALREIQQIRKQTVSAEIRIDIATKELTNHDKQIRNAQENNRFMKDKYTNQELYGWMVQQLSAVYFKSYQLAYDVAKRAERAFRHELGIQTANYIQFGYWDSLKKGLLAAERLVHDIKRMEVAYLEQNKREYEIAKHVSLLQVDPLALVMLRESGRCEFNVPEALFDLDYPGHYMRRLKSVSVTIPCVVGPYTSVPCTVTLLRSQIRHDTSAVGGYGRDLQNDDLRFADLFGAIQSVVTSTGQSDSGMFETNLRDERYLPFEGAGAISTWRLELPIAFRTIDYDSISDVVLHLRYTARDGGEELKTAAVTGLQAAINAMVIESGKGITRLFSLKHEFSTEWQRFRTTVEAATGDHRQVFSFSPERFPFFLRDRFMNERVKVRRLHVLAVPVKETIGGLTLSLSPSKETDEAVAEIEVSTSERYGGACYGLKDYEDDPQKLGDWTLRIAEDDFDALEDDEGHFMIKDLLVGFELEINP